MSTVWEQVTAGAKLVSLPDLYIRLRAVLDDPDFAMADVAQVIGTDPGMTTRLLRIVNSAFFGLSANIETVTRATSLLGTQQVHDLVLATSVAETFQGVSSDQIDMAEFWRRSVRCGVVARLLAESCNVLDSERLFVAGLLREIGHLIMYQTVPELALAAMRQAEERDQPLFEAERDLIGLDYARVGGMLMRQWNLPKPLIHATEFHTEPARATENSLETSIIHLAAAMTDSADGGDKADNWPSRVDAVAWDVTSLKVAQCVECMERAEVQFDRVMELIFPQPGRAFA
ncbi:MAG: HDOD domain-containing protein [Gammaproteobacteria bacterium]|nr:HDOD domain-containing protein [Gammaproteobacteria bacterium]